MAQVDNLVLEISADSSKAIGALNNLSSSLGNLKKNLPTKQKLEETAQGFKALTEQISKLSLSAKNLDKIKAISTIAKNLSKLNSISPSKIKSTAENLDSLQGAMSHISDQAVDKIERLASAFSKLGEANKHMGSLKNVQKTANLSAQANPIATTPVESGVSSREVSEAFSDVSNEAKEATESVGGFWTKFQTVQNLVKTNPISLLANSESADKMSNLAKTAGMSVGVLTKLSKVLGWVGLALSVVSVATKIFTGAIKLVLKPIKNFIGGITTLVKALARIALYRAIRGVLKSITQGLKEGIQNLALYSKALEELDAHSANNVMSRYASEFLYFKNAVATAVIPVLRALIPYVETAINTIIKFINVLAQVGSAIFGTQYTKAKYFWVDYADSLDNASGSAKKLHHQLAGFDELNNLTDTQGGSGSTKLQDALNMFEEADIDANIKNLVDNLVKKIKGGLATIKTAVKPFTDKLESFFDGFKTRVLPNLKKAKDNLVYIWNKALKPILTYFVAGFFYGLAQGDYDNAIEFFENMSKKVADATEKLKTFVDKLDMKKVQEFSAKVGVLVGWFISMYHPIRDNITALDNCHTVMKLLQKFIDEKLNEALKTGISRFNDIKTSVKNWWNEIKTASEKVETLRTNIINFVNNLTIKNLLKDPTTNAQNFKNVLDSVKTVIDSLKNIGAITISIALKLTGLENVKNSLQDIAQSAGNLIPEDSPLGKVINKVDEIVDKNKKTDSEKTPTTAQYGNYGGYGSLQEYLQAQSKKRATGGFVNRGDLFIANEKVPEMIGHIGGNTAVANNDQITEAIAQATYTAMSKALSENNGNVTFVVEGDGDKMFRVFQKKQREYSRQTGMA